MCNPQWWGHVPGIPGRSYCSIEHGARFYESSSTVFINSMVVKLEMYWSFILQLCWNFYLPFGSLLGWKRVSQLLSDIADCPVQVSMDKAGRKATWERISVYQMEKREKDVSLRPRRSQNLSSRNSRDTRRWNHYHLISFAQAWVIMSVCQTLFFNPILTCLVTLLYVHSSVSETSRHWDNDFLILH